MEEKRINRIIKQINDYKDDVNMRHMKVVFELIDELKRKLDILLDDADDKGQEVLKLLMDIFYNNLMDLIELAKKVIKITKNNINVEKVENVWRRKYIRVKGVRWFTNIDYAQRHENLILYKKYYNSEDDKNNPNYTNPEFPKYDNYDAINVDKTADIPCDYDGVMGVPITFLDKYNPEQFEIVALGIVGSCNFTCEKKMEILDKNGKPTGKYTINAKGTLYKKYNPETDKVPAFKNVETGELYSSIYARILIKQRW